MFHGEYRQRRSVKIVQERVSECERENFEMGKS